MFALGRGFSHSRKSASKSPRDLHIRKISLSGSSVGSWDDSSSTCSSSATPTMPSFPNTQSESAIMTRSSFDSNPLASHPSYMAPPRLANRAFLHHEQRRAYTVPDISATLPSTFFNDDTEDEDDDDLGFGFGEIDAETMELSLHAEQPRHMDLPPAASPLDYSAHEREQPQDYFLSQLARRPPMPKSHWSYSTVHTMQSSLDELASGACTPACEAEDVDEADDWDESGEMTPAVLCVAEPVLLLPNFSYKRPSVPQRPSVTASVDKVEVVSKRGWKRRGVVFNKSEAGSDSEQSEEGK